ncbi:MAG: lipopolysaccharide biosynthesis protein [Endomicrobiaceae bacterium]
MNQRKAGVVLSYLSMGLQSIIGLIYVPVLLIFLSKEEYGLYQLVGSVIAYLMIMDFGLAGTTVRYLSRFTAQNNQKAKENLLAVTTYLYFGISFIIIITGIAGLNFLLPFYSKTLSPYEIVLAKQIFWIMLFNVAIVIPGNIFSAIIQASEKFVFLRTVNIINIVLQPALVFAVLYFKSSLVAMVIVQTLCNVCVITANAYYSMYKLKTNIKFHYWDKPLVKEILFFSFFIFLNALMDQVYWKTGQLILGAVSGTAVVAVYAVAMQLDMMFMNFSSNISSVFLPHLSALSAGKNNMNEINNIFVKVGRIQFYIVMLMFLGFWLYGKEFINFWVGADFKEAYLCALVLMGALVIPLIQNTGISILLAKNKHAFRAVIYVLIAVLNVTVSIPVSKYYGAFGCALTTAACLILGQGIIINIYYSKIGIKVLYFFKNIISSLPPVLAVFFIALISKQYIPQKSIVFFILQIVVFCFLFFAAVWSFSFNSYEKNLVAGSFKKVYNKVLKRKDRI